MPVFRSISSLSLIHIYIDVLGGLLREQVIPGRDILRHGIVALQSQRDQDRPLRSLSLIHIYLGGETSGVDGTVVGTYVTSANGSFTVTGLKKGYYICEELESDSGHVIDSAPQSFYVSGEDQDIVTLYFSNAPKGSVLVKKVSSSDNSPDVYKRQVLRRH